MILEDPRRDRRGYVAAAVTRWPDHVWIIMGTLISVTDMRMACRNG